MERDCITSKGDQITALEVGIEEQKKIIKNLEVRNLELTAKYRAAKAYGIRQKKASVDQWSKTQDVKTDANNLQTMNRNQLGTIRDLEGKLDAAIGRSIDSLEDKNKAEVCHAAEVKGLLKAIKAIR